MKIGILQTGHFPDVLQGAEGDYTAMFSRLLDGNGFTFQTWSVVDMEFPNGPTDADGWLITGSRHGAYEDLPFIPPLEALIRSIYAQGVPMLGICFGHQIIAQALGGRVEKVAAGWEVGRKEYDWQGDSITLNAWHQDQVVEVPEGAEVLASHPRCEVAALVYDTRIWTVQAHPEFSETAITGLADTRGKGVVPDDLLNDAKALAGPPNDHQRIARQMAQFLKGEAAA